MPNTPAGENAEVAFFQRGTQYYAAGRFASLAQLFPVNANLLHQAVEMYLKGALSRTHSLDELHALQHNLKRIWRSFKEAFPDPILETLDASLNALHKFERLRYPNEELAGC